jgi:hypothetical protein
MAYAYRHPDMSRRVMIRLDERLPPATDLSISLVVGTAAYRLNAFPVEDRLIVVVNSHSNLEDALLRAAESDFVGIEVWDVAVDERVLIEKLTFHLSFFRAFFDFAHDTDIYNVPGHYSKSGSLAIFTHIHDDATMLKVWERFYARIVPTKDLFVIDHGSTSSPRLVLSPEVNVVAVPRGPVDHRAISQFCNTFQRFLLSQYQWVIHVDADELLLHRRGWDVFKETLSGRNDRVIIKAGHGFDLVHDIDSEAALDMSAPISWQRNRLVSAPIYAKPALCSVPATWRIGFHLVFENHAVVEDEDLWLIHLSYMDLGLHMEKSRKWGRMDVAETERAESPHLYDRPGGSVEKARQLFSALLRNNPVVALPDWMRGMF